MDKFTVESQPAALRQALQGAGVSREDLAATVGVSLRAVHRWLVEEESPNHRAMSPVQLQEILYWLAGRPSNIEFRLPRSLTGIRQLRAAKKRAQALAESANSSEFEAAQYKLAAAKVAALELAQGIDGIVDEQHWLEIIDAASADPIFIIRP